MSRRFRTIFNWLSGQSIIEVVVGLSVVVILAISLITTMLITQKTARSAQNNTTATKLAQQTIEQVRIFRDRNSNGFGGLTIDGTCLILDTPNPNDPGTWGLRGCPSGVPETVTLNNVAFERKITICYEPVPCTTTPSNKKLITVTVSWQESGGLQTVTNKTFFTNWCAGGIVAGSPCPSP